jgi:ankyrin repeat protein
MHNFFLPMTQANIDAYGEDMIRAIRKSDIDSLRTMKNNGRLLQCCNRFGESTIHMACRRSTVDVVSFLIKEGKVSIRVCDDYGRTPLHDAFWTAQPNFELMDLLLDEDPELLFVSDKRGHTPLDYTRKEHWDLWINYLSKRIQNKSHLN